MELAVECEAQNERGEMLSLLAEFTEMPNDIKLFRLSKLMNKVEKSKERREEFKKILSSLPVELVRLLLRLACISFRQVNSTNVCGKGNLLQDAVDIEYSSRDEGKKKFVRILLEFG